ncbi:MAG: tRNA (adenosine(37)-N6)-threonylcarbamoyltransferase complex ATPase subunit type 1 TsaE [Saprospiraceae bacterium]|nr:tRNA (adenosine(37)-N6)-threonylcarbamoyltransferase complex ATPase subunit type 1 TsaE [Saprospiraceae bacterium]
MRKAQLFSLVNEYEYEERVKKKLIRHLDLYRLKNLEEALDIGVEDFLYDDTYCLIEWANIIEPILPDDVLSLKIEILENFERKIVIL